MSTEPYVPSEADVRERWMDAMSTLAPDTASAEFTRFIAKVKADALRSAVVAMNNTDDPDAIHVHNGDIDLWLKAVADRIEGEA